MTKARRCRRQTVDRFHHLLRSILVHLGISHQCRIVVLRCLDENLLILFSLFDIVFQKGIYVLQNRSIRLVQQNGLEFIHLLEAMHNFAERIVRIFILVEMLLQIPDRCGERTA